MQLTKELVESFRAIYFDKYGVAIIYSDAETELKELAKLVRLISEDRVRQNA
jgi:hypothetical protein